MPWRNQWYAKFGKIIPRGNHAVNVKVIPTHCMPLYNNIYMEFQKKNPHKLTVCQLDPCTLGLEHTHPDLKGNYVS